MKIRYLSLLLVILQINICSAEQSVQMSLDQAVSTALENNLQLKLVQEDVVTTQGAATAEQGTFDPLFKVTGFQENTNTTSLNTFAPEVGKVTYWSASLSKKMETGTEVDLTWENKRYKSNSLFTTINPAYISAVSVGISQPLLRGYKEGVQSADLDAAEKNVLGADSQLNNQVVQLVAKVKNAYWQLLYVRQDIEVKKLSLTLAQNLLDDTSRKIEVGVIAPVEIYQSESEVARREEALIASERAIADAEDVLKIILNQPDWNVAIYPNEKPSISKDKLTYETVLANARENRADLQVAELQVDAAEILVKKSQNALKPSLDLDGRIGMGGTDTSYGGSTTNVFGDTDVSWKVGLIFSMFIGSHGTEGSDIIARSNLAKARTSVNLLEQEIIRNCREALRNMNLSLKGIEASVKTSLAVQKRLEAEQNKFDVGLSTALEVLEAQEAYAKALVGQKRAMIDHALAQVEFDRVQGKY